LYTLQRKHWRSEAGNHLRHCKESMGLVAPTYLADTWNSLI
jgi:hypothetical protein